MEIVGGISYYYSEEHNNVQKSISQKDSCNMQEE